MISRVYVINLERRPDRLAHFQEECKREGVPSDLIRVWKAVDGMTHNFSAEEHLQFSSSDLDIHSETGKGCIANQLSHLQVLKDITEECKNDDDICLVFQDDVKLGANFWENVNKVADDMRMIMNAPYVFVGLHAVGAGSYFEDFDLTRQPERSMFFCINETLLIGQYFETINPASLAFLVSKRGALDYLEYTKRGIQYATDRNMNDYLINRRQFFGCYPVLCTGNSKFKSDIFKYDEHAVTRDLLELLDDL